VALALFCIGAIWAWRTHVKGIWLDRFIVFSITAVAIGLSSVVISLVRMAVTSARNRRAQHSTKGFLDYKNDAETSMTAIPQIVGKLSGITREVGTTIERYTHLIMQAGSTKGQLKAMRQLAAKLDTYSLRVDRISVIFSAQGRLLSEGLGGWSDWLKTMRPDRASLGVGFPEALKSFNETLDTSNNQLQTYITTMRNVKGAASTMNDALDRHISSLQAVLNVNLTIHLACSQTLVIIDSLS